MTSSAVNWLADVMISKDKSEWEEILFYYRALGFSEDVAFMEALKEQGRQMLKEGAAGAITGAAAAGGRLAFGQISEGIQNHKNYREAVQNGRQYYALNQLSQGDLAQSLGNMNIEQAYRTMSPEAIMETSGLKPRQAQYLLENAGYSPEGRAARPSANQVYSMLRSTGLNHQETQALMKSKGYSLDSISERVKYAPELDDGPEQIVQKKGSDESDLLANTVDPNLQNEMDLFPEGEVNQNRTFAREDEWSHRKGKGGDYGVTWSSIDQTDYEACFSQLTDNEKVSRAISTRAKWLLNTYDGRNTESLYVIDLNDGAEIERRDGGEGESGVERSKKFEAKLNAAESAGSQILLIHNHPKGLPPSITDINALLRSERAVGIVVGHDGSVYYYTKPEKAIPKEDFNVAIRKYKRYTDKTAQEKSLDELAKRFHFTWGKWR